MRVPRGSSHYVRLNIFFPQAHNALLQLLQTLQQMALSPLYWAVLGSVCPPPGVGVNAWRDVPISVRPKGEGVGVSGGKCQMLDFELRLKKFPDLICFVHLQSNFVPF